MSDEYWATFSIYDHRRSSLYRKSLILFDRVVIPVPTAEVGSLKSGEISRLEADVDYLESQDAAVRFDWDPAEFKEWQKQTTEQAAVDGEALARLLVKDPPFATRLQLSRKYQLAVPKLLPPGVDSVIAVPVYGTLKRYEEGVRSLWTAERATLEMVIKQLPMPDRRASLREIVRLRGKAQFRESLYSLRKWQTDTVRDLLQTHNTGRVIRAAARDLERYTRQYREAMHEARFKKVETGVISMLALGATLAAGVGPAITTLAALAPPLLSIRSLVRPCWKEVAEKECAPAGVIYAASRL